MPERRVAIVGAGIGGLVAAALLSARGVEVALYERADAPGGKMRAIAVGGAQIDAGPTVFTMRSVFDAIFADAGASFDDAVELAPLDILARHAWSQNERLDLFADTERSAEAIGDFAGADAARGYRRFCAKAAQTYRALEKPFILASRPSVERLIAGAGFSGLPDLWRINPFVSLWRALDADFSDIRLRQLFGRYATYCGSSPFQAPATLMLIAHVEQEGVWSVAGGMHRIAQALAELAESHGAALSYATDVAEILTADGRVAGLLLADGTRIAADAVVVNADVGALAAGLFGGAVKGAAKTIAPKDRSLSAVTFAMVATTESFPLARHNVFFSQNYPAEFEALRQGRLPADPTVYLCAPDRQTGAEPDGKPERLLWLVNAPPTGDTPTNQAEIERCAASAMERLRSCGLRIAPGPTVVTNPEDFARLYPGTSGALYGRATHGWRASFTRPAARTAIPGLYLAGGSVHPGAGVPMAALSGRMAAASLLTDLTSTARSPGTAIFGGMSMR